MNNFEIQVTGGLFLAAAFTRVGSQFRRLPWRGIWRVWTAADRPSAPGARRSPAALPGNYTSTTSIHTAEKGASRSASPCSQSTDTARSCSRARIDWPCSLATPSGWRSRWTRRPRVGRTPSSRSRFTRRISPIALVVQAAQLQLNERSSVALVLDAPAAAERCIPIGVDFVTPITLACDGAATNGLTVPEAATIAAGERVATFEITFPPTRCGNLDTIARLWAKDEAGEKHFPTPSNCRRGCCWSREPSTIPMSATSVPACEAARFLGLPVSSRVRSLRQQY